MTAAAVHAARQLASHLRTTRPLKPPMWLTANERGLFDRMAPPDQMEGLAVATTLETWGWGADRQLLAAGALHDLGKSLAPPQARYRVLLTAVETLAPALLPLLASHSSTMAALAGHAATGGALAAAAGLDPDVVRLIARHHEPPTDERMAALQRADGLH